MRYFLLIAVLLVTTNVDAQKLVKTKLSDKITVHIPASFTPMSEEDKMQRYESARLPIALFTDPDRMAEFGVNHSYSLWPDKDLHLLQEFYNASILELYDKVDFIKQEITNVNGRDFAIFEFDSVVYPENKFQGNITKYTYLMYTISEGTTYLFNFTCEHRVKNQWQSTAQKIMKSVKLK